MESKHIEWVGAVGMSVFLKTFKLKDIRRVSFEFLLISLEVVKIKYF